MDHKIVETLTGQKVSVMFDGLNRREAWNGIVDCISGEWLVLKIPPRQGVNYQRLIVKVSDIISIAEYVEEEKLVG